MSRKLTYSFLLFCVLCHPATYAQYFQWAHNYWDMHGMNVHDLAVDRSGNSFVAGAKFPVQSTAGVFYLVKENSNGFPLWQKSVVATLNMAIANSVAVDYAGNSYVSGTIFGQFTIDGITTTAPAFLIKFSPQGNVLWLDSIGSAPLHDYRVAADSAGNSYITDGFFTKKINKNGVTVWQNLSYGGTDIAVDKNKNVYLLTTTTLTKLWSGGGFAWSRSHGGNQLAADAAGNTFVASNDSIFKYTSSGSLSWSNKALHGNGIAVDLTGDIYLTLGNNIRKLSGNGTTILWALSTQNADCKFIATNNINCFIAGDYDPLNETVICPFHFTRLGSQDQYPYNRLFLSKVNQVLAIPFQANIYTPPIPGDRLCSGVYFQVPYQVSLNAVSSFGPGNQFRARLINLSNGFDMDIGRADSAFIPLTIPESSNYRVRVVSTNPVVTGDWNSPQVLFSELDLNHLNNSLSPSGNISICSGSSVDLHAGQSQNNYRYYWYENNVNISNGLYDTVKTVSNASDYYFRVFTSDFICQLKSPTASVSVLPLPSAPITASGPLTFCNGDSVVLATTQAAGLSYQWKKNNTNIIGATFSAYTAKTSGTYKVKVTNQSGCTKISSGKVVNVNCREGNSISEKVEIYPVLFHESFMVNVKGNGNYRIRVFDATGRLVLVSASTHEASEINLSGSAPGLYMVEVEQGGEVMTSKVIKQ